MPIQRGADTKAFSENGQLSEHTDLPLVVASYTGGLYHSLRASPLMYGLGPSTWSFHFLDK